MKTVSINDAFRLLLVGFLTLFLHLHATAQVAHGTAAEAVELVKKARSYLKKQGREKALSEFSNPKGAFNDRDLYIFVVDRDGNMIAHGANPKLIGKRVTDIRDVNGKPFGQAMMDLAFKQDRSGWIDYVFIHPVTKNMEPKSSYIEREGDLLIGCGIFK